MLGAAPTHSRKSKEPSWSRVGNEDRP